MGSELALLGEAGLKVPNRGYGICKIDVGLMPERVAGGEAVVNWMTRLVEAPGTERPGSRSRTSGQE